MCRWPVRNSSSPSGQQMQHRLALNLGGPALRSRGAIRSHSSMCGFAVNLGPSSSLHFLWLCVLNGGGGGSINSPSSAQELLLGTHTLRRGQRRWDAGQHPGAVRGATAPGAEQWPGGRGGEFAACSGTFWLRFEKGGLQKSQPCSEVSSRRKCQPCWFGSRCCRFQGCGLGWERQLGTRNVGGLLQATTDGLGSGEPRARLSRQRPIFIFFK